MRVFVLLFNARTENEGIHTVQMGDRNKILMFESEDDATRYALLLEAQDFPTASVEPIDSEEVEAFCRSVGYEWEIVQDGKLEIPPEKNLNELDWNPQEKASTKNSYPEETESEIPDHELDSIRRRLEGLL
jgi:hypothetical protein